MHNVLKSAVLGVGLLTAFAATASAQSLSALPPANSATAPTAIAPTASDKIYPNPGNDTQWEGQDYQPTQSDSDPSRHPYSKPHFGPAPD